MTSRGESSPGVNGEKEIPFRLFPREAGLPDVQRAARCRAGSFLRRVFPSFLNFFFSNLPRGIGGF